MKWPLGNGGATYLGNVTDTVQTVSISDTQCTVQAGWYFPREPTNFVRRKFSKSQEILKNMHQISKKLNEYCV